MKDTTEYFTNTSEISIQELEKALKIAAKVVAMYGDAYLPGFLRLRNEVMVAKQISQARAEAILLATSMTDV